MRTKAIATLFAAMALGLSCRAPVPAHDSEPTSTESLFGGEAPTDFRWKREEAVTQCLVPARPDSGMHPVPMWTDSASIIDVAFRFLGTRVNRRTDIPVLFIRRAEGTLVQISDTNPRALDGTATVYVTPHGCVTFLGW